MSKIITDTSENTSKTSIDVAEQWETWRGLYEFGFNLVPLREDGDKTPKVQSFARWFDERQPQWCFDAFYRLSRPCNMGIITGKYPGGLPGFVVLDPDDDEATEYVDRHCPETPMGVQTRRGRHRWYRHPGGIYIKQINTHEIDGVEYKIDRKADHNYTVAPGSIHSSGHVYRWINPLSPELVAETPVFDPKWLPEDTKVSVSVPANWNDFDHDQACENEPTPLETRRELAATYAARTPGTTEGEGTASNAALRLAGKLALGFLLPYKDAVDVMLDHWANKPDQNPPWELKEIEHKVKSAIQKASDYPGEPGDVLRKYDDNEEEQLESIITRSIPGAVPPIDASRYEAGDEPVATHTETKASPILEVNDLWNLMDLMNYAESIKRVWIAEGWLQAGHLAVLSGREKRGKSTCIYDLMTAAISGQRWMDHIPCMRTPVLLLDYENPADYVWHNLRPMLEARGVEDFREVADYYGQIAPPVIREKASPLVAEYAIGAVKRMQDRTGIGEGVMVIDTAAPAWMAMFEDPGWTNSNTQVRKALEIAQEVSRKTNWTTLVIYHDNKTSASAAGSYEWYGTPDVYLRFEREIGNAVGNLSIFGRLLNPPEPVEFTRRGALLVAQAKGTEAAQEKKVDDAKRNHDILNLIPRGRDNAATQTKLVNAIREKLGKEASKATATAALKELATCGRCSTVKGRDNSIMYWIEDQGSFPGVWETQNTGGTRI